VKVDFGPITPEFYPWLRENLDPVLCDDTNGIVCYNVENNDILAASVMDNWTKRSCQIHVWIGNPIAIRHGFLYETFEYIYLITGRKTIFGLTPANNAKAIKFNKHVGFKEIFRLPEAYDEGVDYILFQMDKDECRWFRPAALEKVA